MSALGLGLSSVLQRNSPGGGIRAGLVEYWAMDGTSGDEVGLHAGLTLTATNAPGYGSGHIYTNARQVLEASGQYFEGAFTELDFGGNVSFTVACWFLVTTWPTSSPLDYHWFACNGGNQWHGGYGLRINGGQALVGNLFAKTDGYSDIHYSPAIPGLDAWHLVVQWYDAAADVHGMQMNATTAKTTAWTYGCANPNYEFTVGKKPGDTINYCDGRFGPIMAWSRALTQAERTWLWNDGNGRAYAEL